MSPLQRPRQFPPVDAAICLLGSVPCNVRMYGNRTGGKCATYGAKNMVY
ncbi:unnamed protein product [Staurois parvus]|uniref:Uncharacterized protein n=1 Tax=Staurois parvus TaxID=386267 RepID=A0ABN9AU23_9NEOB|nr:unnamed protein product [Staurois parvus]